MKINKRTAIYLGIFLVLFMMTVGNAAAVQEEGIRTRIISNEAEQGNPDIDGDRIVWQDSRNGGSGDSWDPTGNWDIYMYDLSTSTETQITTNNSTQKLPAIYEDRIVWEDNRNGNWDIYMYDLSTSMETRITANESNQSEPAIYEDKIVWQDDRNGNWDIYMYDLSTSKETRITTNETNQSDPAIYGDKIVWVDEVRIDDPEIAVDPYFSRNNFICVYDLSTSKETWLHSGLRIWNPSIYGDIIVWGEEDCIADNNMIVMYDLSASRLNMIAIERTASPDIYKDRIVWTQDFWDFRNHVLMYNISTFTQTELTAEGVHESGSGSFPAIYGDRIVWVPYNNGINTSGIYMFTLASTGSTPIDNIEMEAGTETQITTNGSDQSNPTIYGDRIVWADSRNGKSIDQLWYPSESWNIYMYDLSAHKEIQITNDNSDKQPHSIYEDRIVWNGWRNGNLEAYVYNISTFNRTKIVDGVSDHPVIYKDRIVWASNNIYMYNLSTSTKTQITNDTSCPDYPAIYGDRIVWTESRNEGWNEYGAQDGNLDLYMYDLSTSTETQITTNNSTQRLPAIYEDRIVWEDKRNGNWDIYMYNLSTSTETQITTNEYNQEFPAIYGDRIVWVDDRSGRHDIYMYNLSTSRETQITTSGSVWFYNKELYYPLGVIKGVGPAIYGDRIVWEDVRNGNYDIYMFTLASAEVPTPDGNETDDGNGTSNGTGNGTQVPDNNSDNGAGNETGNGTQVPDNNSDNGAGNETDDGTQCPDNFSAELTPLDSMQALKEYVECAYECHEKTKTGLVTLLDTSKCLYENGEDEKAISILKSFIHLAEKMKECKQISADEADYMVREAKKILDQMDERDGKANVAYEVCEETKPICKPVCEETKPVCKPVCTETKPVCEPVCTETKPVCTGYYPYVEKTIGDEGEVTEGTPSETELIDENVIEEVTPTEGEVTPTEDATEQAVSEPAVEETPAENPEPEK